MDQYYITDTSFNLKPVFVKYQCSVYVVPNIVIFCSSVVVMLCCVVLCYVTTPRTIPKYNSCFGNSSQSIWFSKKNNLYQGQICEMNMDLWFLAFTAPLKGAAKGSWLFRLSSVAQGRVGIQELVCRLSGSFKFKSQGTI